MMLINQDAVNIGTMMVLIIFVVESNICESVQDMDTADEGSVELNQSCDPDNEFAHPTRGCVSCSNVCHLPKSSYCTRNCPRYCPEGFYHAALKKCIDCAETCPDTLSSQRDRKFCEDNCWKRSTKCKSDEFLYRNGSCLHCSLVCGPDKPPKFCRNNCPRYLIYYWKSQQDKQSILTNPSGTRVLDKETKKSAGKTPIPAPVISDGSSVVKIIVTAVGVFLAVLTVTILIVVLFRFRRSRRRDRGLQRSVWTSGFRRNIHKCIQETNAVECRRTDGAAPRRPSGELAMERRSYADFIGISDGDSVADPKLICPTTTIPLLEEEDV